MQDKKENNAGKSLIGAAAQLKSKVSPITALLAQKTQTSEIVEEITSKIELAFQNAIKVCESGSLSDKDSLTLLIKTTKDVMASMRINTKNLSKEVSKLAGYIEGINASVTFIEEAGNAAIRESKKIEELANSEVDLNAKRKPGERPETLRVKRSAADYRNSVKLEKQEEDLDS